MNKTALARLGAYADIFLRPEFKVQEEQQPASEREALIPDVSYSQHVGEFIQLCYDDGWINRELNWPEWMTAEEAARLRDEPDELAKASVEQLSKLLTVLIRQERFVDGSLGAAFDVGLVPGIVARALVLAQEADQPQAIRPWGPLAQS